MSNPFEIIDARLGNIEAILLDIKINKFNENLQSKTSNEYLTRTDVAKMLNVDLSTLHHWCKKGKLHPYGIGNRVYFKRSEIEAALKPI